ncbi:hypothetical protein [Janthinobacterium fluminis]|uniref:Lipoprotein n=1 Tax=Janthinobacterium fluminis TaxID=2987524 RepID=A0ABT5K1D5_9BURK|nr:hypothetical protein [Janthinobacterium fluminis]MDC8758798.1 hypothetical protein [Janthinobacterium fluminis]
MKKIVLSLAILSSLAACASTDSGTTAPQAEQEKKEYLTGSRIPRGKSEGSGNVRTMSAQDIQDLRDGPPAQPGQPGA